MVDGVTVVTEVATEDRFKTIQVRSLQINVILDVC